MNFRFLDVNSAGKNKGRLIVNKETFFEGTDNVGYFNRTTFQNMMGQMREAAPRLFKQYNNFFNCCQEGFAIRNTVLKQTHLVNQQEYYYVIFTKGRVRIETTIYDVENIGKFIKDYADGLINTDFNLSDLIEEASK